MWTTNFNFAYNQNTVLKETMREDQRCRQGYPVGAIFALKTAGPHDQGYPLFLNKEGEAVSVLSSSSCRSGDRAPMTLPHRIGASSIPIWAPAIVLTPAVFNNTFTYKAFNWELTSASILAVVAPRNPHIRWSITTVDANDDI